MLRHAAESPAASWRAPRGWRQSLKHPMAALVCSHRLRRREEVATRSPLQRVLAATLEHHRHDATCAAPLPQATNRRHAGPDRADGRRAHAAPRYRPYSQDDARLRSAALASSLNWCASCEACARRRPGSDPARRRGAPEAAGPRAAHTQAHSVLEVQPARGTPLGAMGPAVPHAPGRAGAAAP